MGLEETCSVKRSNESRVMKVRKDCNRNSISKITEDRVISAKSTKIDATPTRRTVSRGYPGPLGKVGESSRKLEESWRKL